MRKYSLMRTWLKPPEYVAKLLCALLFSALSFPMLAAEPSPPEALRYTIYSGTSAELFWDRASDDGVVVGYDVQLNGTLVETRDASSYYTNALTAGQTYNITVTTVDDEGDRSVPVSVSFVGGDRSIPSSPDAPTTDVPSTSVAAATGLTATVYSKKSAELFWDRPETFGLTYEIRRNDNVVTITDGVSYYDNQLSADSEYIFKVTAINLQGVRSSASQIAVKTAPGNDQPQQPTIPSTGNVVVPTGLKVSIYSAKSAELFWDRPETFGLTYQVFRNGAVVGTTDGVSFYTNQLLPGTTYTFEVVAISSSNNRSEPVAIMFNMPGTGGGGTTGPTDPTDPNTPSDLIITEPADLFQRDGYSPFNVVRVDLRTAIGSGFCNADDESGCTLADVLADTDKYDDHTVDINVHFQSDDFADDGTVSNAELRLRGGGSRFAPQKSFRIKLDSKQELWRDERHLQLNKHPFDLRRMRNKVAMDVMSEIPNLPSLRTQFVNLWIDNGEGPVDYGLFTHVERVNEYFLRKRGWNEDSNIYKAEYFRFAKSDLANLQVDADGEPLDEELFERTLEIENGDDHRLLVDMMSALHNPNRSFQSVLEQYFDRDNVMAWIAANILLRQNDAVRHNFILYNPVGTEKFYFIPWDYDAAVGAWSEPPNDLSNDSLRQRVEYGYALAATNPFLENFYRQPGIHDEILELVEHLRQNTVTDQSMTERVDQYIDLVAPFQSRDPDSVHNPNFTVYAAKQIIGIPGRNEEALRSRFGVLMAPILEIPTLEMSQWRFSWNPAHDVTGVAGSISYRLQIARTPTFDVDAIVVDIDAIDGASDLIVQNVDADQLPPDEYFVRVIATPANEPERNWQVSGNKLYYNNQAYYGVLLFVIP